MMNMSSLPFAALAEGGGFRSDPRFAAGPGEAAASADPIAQAWADGHTAGFSEAQSAALANAEAEAAARGRIELTLVRLDAKLTEQLRQRLLATVEALCEAAIAPIALDEGALAARVARATAMLARADDEKVLRLHPEDLKLIGRQLPEGLEVQEDAALERGALRIETANGGIEDGPANWCHAIKAALTQC